MPPEATATIRSKIQAVRDAMQAGDPDGLAPRLQAAAVKAIYGGFGSKEWYDYMEYFANSPKQLRRLCTREIDCHIYNEPARAYLVGNAACLPGTWETFMHGVDHYLDSTLDQAPDDYEVEESYPAPKYNWRYKPE